MGPLRLFVCALMLKEADLSQFRRRIMTRVHLSLVTYSVVSAWISTSIFILSLLIFILNTFSPS